MSFWTRDVTGMDCNGPMTGSTGFDVGESLTIMRNICQDVAHKHISLIDGYSTVGKTVLGDSNMRLSVSLANSSDCSDRTVSEREIDQATCEQTFSKILDSCSPPVGDQLGFYGGSASYDCAHYFVVPEGNEIIRCGGNPSNRAVDMYPQAMDKAINEHCDQPYTLSPLPVDTATFSQTVPFGWSYNNYLTEGLVVRTRAQFSEQAQHNCTEPKAFQTGGDECRRKFRALKDQCGDKGGGLSENSINGCVVWTLWGEKYGG